MSPSAGETRVGMVGAGPMGAEIALMLALGGIDVLLDDRDRELKVEMSER
ncbi:MAG TPA: 3-hydroxyacyl-CoA dehydrogenase NAD-binding domain-containing protein [Allosphingosinicella sp.]|nr:3-hydroxyacyl-CoA dehydrogenase NAD-binding domain-containing protein [Allosphingosinicella sp.]